MVLFWLLKYGGRVRVAACDRETDVCRNACLVRSLIRVLVCVLVSPSHVLGVQFKVMEGR